MKTRSGVWSCSPIHSSRIQNSCLCRQTPPPTPPALEARYVATALFLWAKICCRLLSGHTHTRRAFYGGWNINSEKQTVSFAHELTRQASVLDVLNHTIGISLLQEKIHVYYLIVMLSLSRSQWPRRRLSNEASVSVDVSCVGERVQYQYP
jgi:hypothetical protein